MPETGYKWKQLGLLAQKLYIDYANLDYEVFLSALADAKVQIVDQLDARSNTQLYVSPWYGKHTLGRMIQLNTAAFYKNDTARVRRWRRTHLR